MPRPRLLLAALGCAALLPALPVYADPSSAPQPAAASTAADPSTPNEGAEQRRISDRQAFLDARLAAVRAGLELSPDQEKLWAPVDSALRNVVNARHALRKGRFMADGPARLKARGEHLIALGQALQKLADAGGPLASTMTPGQKRRLPRLARHLPRRALQMALGVENGSPDGGVDYDRRGFWHHGHGEGWMMRHREGWWHGGDHGDAMRQGGMDRHDDQGPGMGDHDRDAGPNHGGGGEGDRG